MATSKPKRRSRLAFLRLTSAGEVYKGNVPPVGNTGKLLTTLAPGQKLKFSAEATSGEGALFSVAASWPGRICKPYVVESLGVLGDKNLKAKGLWFTPPPANTPIPSKVDFEFDGNGTLASTSGNGKATVDIADVAARDAGGNIIEHASHYVALMPKGSAKVRLTFADAAFPTLRPK